MKRILALILALLCFGCFFACTDYNGNKGGADGNNIDPDATYAETDITAIKDKMIADLKIEGAMDMGEAILLSYGIDEKDIKESACFITMDGVFTSEAIIIKAVDDDAAQRIGEKLEVRHGALLEQSKNYDADNYALAQECEVKTYGHIVTLFFAPDHEGMTEILEASLSE